nr:MAG TPA: hypothetical protein [Caudoviricetes sp.]
MLYASKGSPPRILSPLIHGLLRASKRAFMVSSVNFLP